MSRRVPPPSVVAPPADRTRRRGALLVLLCLTVFLHPVVGNGPEPDPATVYEADPVEVDAPNGTLARHPAVSGDFTVSPAVTGAATEPYRRPTGEVPPGVADLRAFEFFWAQTESRYYAIDARTENGTFVLESRPVAAGEVAAALAVPADEADPPVRRAARTGRASADFGDDAREVDTGPVLVGTTDGYALVTARRGTAPDPYRPVKLGAYALAAAGVLVGAGLHASGRTTDDGAADV